MQPNEKLESKTVKLVALIITVLAGIVKIIGAISNIALPIIVNIFLALGIIYFISLMLQWLGNRFINGLGGSVSRNLVKHLERTVEPLIDAVSEISKNLILQDELRDSVLQNHIKHLEKTIEPLIIIVSEINKNSNLPSETKTTHPTGSLENTMYKYIASRYGIGYTFMDIDFVIHKDGSAIITRTITIEAFSEIDKLDTYLFIPEESRTGEKREIDSVSVKSLTVGRTVDITLNKNSKAQQLSALLTISPSLKSGQIMQYEMKESLPVGLYAINILQEEYDTRTQKLDYAGWNISRPSKELSLKVHFPEYFRPTVYSAEVRYASASIFPAERIQYEEKNRLTPQMALAPQGDHYVFKLDVNFPMTGLIYILSWQPVIGREKIDKRTTKPQSTIATTTDLSKLHQILITRFSESELKTLCFNLELDYDALSGEGNINKAREIIAYFKRRNRISDLIKAGKKQRQDIDWSSSSE